MTPPAGGVVWVKYDHLWKVYSTEPGPWSGLTIIIFDIGKLGTHSYDQLLLSSLIHFHLCSSSSTLLRPPFLQESCVALKLQQHRHWGIAETSNTSAPGPGSCQKTHLFQEEKKSAKAALIVTGLYNRLTWADWALQLFGVYSTDSSQRCLFLSTSLFKDTVNFVNSSVSFFAVTKTLSDRQSACGQLSAFHLQSLRLSCFYLNPSFHSKTYPT